ncbi:hypothetical protein HYV22_01535 [Candidatus Gottesmanbacteria bacterium]|nr:hypothetical protein [Candidatus Gottesmanbacteria bacterium]
MNVGRQIVEELGELAGHVGSEVVKAPKEIAGKALESLGSKSGKKQQSQSTTSGKPSETESKLTPLDQLDQKKARAALEYLAGNKKREPSVWERIQMEEQQKKEQAAKQAAQAATIAPVFTPSKPRRGNLYGISPKASMEKSRNVRQD